MANQKPLPEVAQAIGRIPSGVAILTAADGTDATGMLASWYQQASFEPLMVSVCVKKGRPIQSLIERSRKFVLNLIGEDPKRMFKHFGAGFPPGANAFEGIDFERCPAGIRLADAIAVIECDLGESVEAGDNVLFLGIAVGGRCRDDAGPYVHLRKSGLNY